MNDLVINPASTIQRNRLLAEYFEQNVLAGKTFICPFFKECSDSHEGLFYEGQLHHVGKHYDMFTSGNPFRVMVVGQEYGHGPSHVSMEDRSQMVVTQTGIQKSFSNRNPHMRGTTSVLRLIFGIPLGDEHANEFLQTEDDRFHLFDAFSLVNYLLCSAISVKEGRRGKSTPIMRRNCLSHFKKAVDILEPTVVIVQGKSYWTSIQKAFSNLNKITDTFYTAEINQQSAMIAVFTHPSTPDNIHNWGRDAKTPYLLNTVVPTILSIRQRLFPSSKLKGEFIMPTISEQPSRSPYSPSGKPDYDKIFSQIKTGLLERFPQEINYRKPKFEHSAPNRMRIYLDRISGSHYQITFRRDRYEFALHFESTPAKSLERRQAFDPHLQELSSEVGFLVKSGPIENNGWMGVWYDRKLESIDAEKVNMYIDQYSRFITATFPILVKLYSNSIFS